MKPLCIYHANCADGFTAAWVAHTYFTGEVDLYPGVYQQPPPNVLDRDVYLVDFSYKRPVIEAMREVAHKIVILDHHKSAIEDLAGVHGIETVFDIERSGARIAWDYWFPGREPPPLLLHVEDRDLWRFALPRTREIQAALFSYPYDIDTWGTLMTIIDLPTLAQDGRAIERKHHKDIDELLRVTTRRMMIGRHSVPVANLPYTLSSDAGHKLAQGEPFAACYWDTPTGRTFSLRSDENGLDVSLVAAQYGGGGHKHAAGFTVSRAEAIKMEGPL